MRRLLFAFCILASESLFMPLADAALTPSSNAVPEISTLLFLACGLTGLVGYRRWKRMV